MSRDLLVIVTIKNNALLTAMRAAGCETAAALARDSGVSYTHSRQDLVSVVDGWEMQDDGQNVYFTR